MIMTVKLTINLPEKLRRRAKARAVLNGTTVSEVVRAALEAYAAGWGIEEIEDVRAAREVEAKLAAGQEKLYSHDEVWAEPDAAGERNDDLPD